MFTDSEFSSHSDIEAIINDIKEYINNSSLLTKIQKLTLCYYLSSWKKYFAALDDDSKNTDKIIFQQFSLPIIFDFTKHILYVRFNIDYINSHLENFETLTYKDIMNDLKIPPTPDNISSYTRKCLNSGPIITVNTFFTKNTFLIIDGNHRFHFVKTDNILNFPVKNIGYHQLNYKLFNSKFSYAIFLFINDINIILSEISNKRIFYKSIINTLKRL